MHCSARSPWPPSPPAARRPAQHQRPPPIRIIPVQHWHKQARLTRPEPWRGKARARSPVNPDDASGNDGPGHDAARHDGQNADDGHARAQDEDHVLLAIADAEGDGAVSFEEVTAIHQQIFDAVDADNDGKVTPEEVQAFMRE